MKKLTHYKKNGFDFTIIQRVGKLAIAHGVDDDKATTFELIEVQSHNGKEIHGKHYKATEYPPCNNQWGIKGWTFNTLEGAMNRMDKLTN